MAYKKVLLEVKVNALREAIELKDIDIIADKYGISRDTIKNDYNKLVWQIDGSLPKTSKKQHSKEGLARFYDWKFRFNQLRTP